MSKSIHACQSYSKPKVGRFWDTMYVYGQIFPTYLKYLTPNITLQIIWLCDKDKSSYVKIMDDPMLKAISLSANAPNHVTYEHGVRNNYIFGIPDPTSPFHYTTFMGLRCRLRVAYRWRLHHCFFLSKIPSYFWLCGKIWCVAGVKRVVCYFSCSNLKRQALGWLRVAWAITCKNRLRGLTSAWMGVATYNVT